MKLMVEAGSIRGYVSVSIRVSVDVDVEDASRCSGMKEESGKRWNRDNGSVKHTLSSLVVLGGIEGPLTRDIRRGRAPRVLYSNTKVCVRRKGGSSS